MYSDDSEFEEPDHTPIVVEVKSHGRSPTSGRRTPTPAKRRPRPAARRHAHRQEEIASDVSEEDYSEDEDDEEEDELYTARPSPSGRRPGSRSRTAHTKGRNGKRGVNMTPPDKLLAQTRKKAEKFTDRNKVDAVIKERVKALALTRIVYGYNHWRMAEAHVNLAEDYLDMKSYIAQAEYHTENAMSIMLNSVHTTSTENEKADVFGILFRLNYIQAKAQLALKKYPEAEAALKKSDRAYQACSKLSCITDDECDDMEIKYTHVAARLSWRQKKYAIADTQYEKVLDLTRRRYGDDAIELVEIYQESGRLEQSKGRHANHEKAIEMFLQAHSIASVNYRDSSVEVVDTALALAQAYAITGREEAESSAEKYLNECLSNCTAVYGPQHKKTLEVQDELARLHIRTQREQEALDLLRSSLSLKGEAYGDYSEAVSDTHKMIASIHLAQGNIERALRAYQKCLNIEGYVLGKKHKKYKDTEKTIDILIASPGLSKNFVLNTDDQLKKRPRFNAISKTK